MTTPEPRAGLSTRAIHGGRPHEPHTPVVEPLVQTVMYHHPVGTEEGLRYPRYGNMPNAESVQRRLALLEGAEAALVLSSGMGATACALTALLRPGDHLLCSSSIYGGTRRLLNEEFARLGIGVTYVDPTESRVFRKKMRTETRAIFLETPVNPTCRVIDLRPFAQLSKDNGLALVVDSTFASPVNFRPLEHGADVVLHSATKLLNGHHDVLAGAVMGTAPFVEEVRQKMMLWGQSPDPFACWLLERGLKTLAVRVRQANANAMAMAQWCAADPRVSRVHYPGLASHPDHALATEVMDGYGTMLAIELAQGEAAVPGFLERLTIISHATSLGGVDTLVSEPRYSSHAAMTPAERAAAGIPDGFVRISAGIEDAEDLIADLDRALG